MVWHREAAGGSTPECTILQSNSYNDFLVESPHQ
jgi:hypothetical protein